MKLVYLIFFLIICNVKADIVADFKASKKTAFVGEEIYFENLSKGDSLSFRWDFGDFYSSFSKSPVHIFNVEGEFDVKLIAYNDTGSDTIVKKKYISIHTQLKAKFEYDIKGATGGYVVICYNMSKGNIKEWKWNFYNGYITSEQNPTGTYDTPGNYNIMLKVNDGVFTDSLFIPNVITVHHPQINIENVNREHIYYDVGSNMSIGGREISNGYIFGTIGSVYHKVIKFNHNKVESWTKQYDIKYFSSIKYDVGDFDNTWIALNSDVYYTNIEVVDYRGEVEHIISDPFKANSNGKYEIEDIKSISSGMAVIANFGKTAMLNIYNTSKEVIYEQTINEEDCLIDDYNIDFLKIIEAKNKDLYIFTRKYSESTDDYKYYYTQLNKTSDSYECANIANGLCVCNEIPEIPFDTNAEFIIYNDNDMLYIQDRKVFNVKNFKLENPEYFNYSNLVHTHINDIALLSNDKFAVAGKFNGHMKLSVVDLHSDFVVDYLANRLGEFQSVYFTDNNNIVLSASIKKNYEEYSLYYLNIPYDAIMGVGDKPDKISIFPNPANDFIRIDGIINSEINIFDVLGNTIDLNLNINSDYIDISELPNGLYFLEINNEYYKFLKK